MFLSEETHNKLLILDEKKDNVYTLNTHVFFLGDLIITKKLYGVNLDEQTCARLERFQQENGLCRSAAIRLIVAQALGRHETIERKQ